MPRTKKTDVDTTEKVSKKKIKENKTEEKEEAVIAEGEENFRDVKLSDDFILRRDRNCMWIEEKGDGKKGKAAGKIVWNRVTGYFNRNQFAYLFQSFVNRKFRSIDDTSSPTKYLKEMKDIEKRTYEMIETMLKEINE